jgi:hypothetical protein
MSAVPAGHNYLAALAADIRALHASARRSAEQVARDAVEAGRKLIEAKAALPHGQWQAWLRDHADINERTARLYMQLARSGLEIGNIAEMGFNAALKAIDPAIKADLRLAKARRHEREAWKHMLEAGRYFGAIREAIGAERFAAFVTERGSISAEAALLADIAQVTDASGDVAALLARDDVPKQFTFRPITEAQWLAIRERFSLTEPEEDEGAEPEPEEPEPEPEEEEGAE